MDKQTKHNIPKKSKFLEKTEIPISQSLTVVVAQIWKIIEAQVINNLLTPNLLNQTNK